MAATREPRPAPEARLRRAPAKCSTRAPRTPPRGPQPQSEPASGLRAVLLAGPGRPGHPEAHADRSPAVHMHMQRAVKDTNPAPPRTGRVAMRGV